MAFDSSTLCARTAAGEAELAKPSQGLSLGQRRVLSLLQDPAAVDELAQNHHLDPDKLARDLTRLAELRLVNLQGPAVSEPPPPEATPISMAPVVIGHGARRSPALPLAIGVALLALAAGTWYATRTPELPHAGPPAAALPTSQAAPALPSSSPVSLPIASPSTQQPPLAARATNEATPAVAVVLRGNGAAPADLRPEIRPGLVAVAASAASALPAPKPAEPAPAREANARVAESARTVPVAPVVPAASPPVNVAPAVAPNSEPPPPPIQLAAAAPTAAAPRPVPVAELKAITRDAPDFPREAISAGVKGGVVTARIHVEANGKVSAVDILAGQPPHVFDRAVRNALSRWQFEPMAAGRTSDVEVNFQRE